MGWWCWGDGLVILVVEFWTLCLGRGALSTCNCCRTDFHKSVILVLYQSEQSVTQVCLSRVSHQDRLTSVTPQVFLTRVSCQKCHTKSHQESKSVLQELVVKVSPKECHPKRVGCRTKIGSQKRKMPGVACKSVTLRRVLHCLTIVYCTRKSVPPRMSDKRCAARERERIASLTESHTKTVLPKSQAGHPKLSRAESHNNSNTKTVLSECHASCVFQECYE